MYLTCILLNTIYHKNVLPKYGWLEEKESQREPN